MRRLAQWAETAPINRVEMGGTALGIITSSTCYQYVKEVFGDQVSILKLGMVNPLPEQLIRNGGTGRIRVFGIDEFDHADVTLDQNANIKCDMVKIAPLSKVGGETNEDDTTPPNRQPVDPRIWYETQGRSVLEALISDLNSRGHSKLTLREDGDICIEQGEDAVSQEHLNNFPQKVYWPRLAEVLESNGLAAEVTAQGIQVSW